MLYSYTAGCGKQRGCVWLIPYLQTHVICRPDIYVCEVFSTGLPYTACKLAPFYRHLPSLCSNRSTIHVPHLAVPLLPDRPASRRALQHCLRRRSRAGYPCHYSPRQVAGCSPGWPRFPAHVAACGCMCPAVWLNVAECGLRSPSA